MKYIGETGPTLKQRDRLHKSDSTAAKERSALYIHIRESIHLGCAKETTSYVNRHIVFVADMFLLFFVVGLRILGILYGSFSVFSLILKTFW